MAVMVLVILWLGLFPRPVLKTVEPVLNAIQFVNHREHGEIQIPDQSNAMKLQNITTENTEIKSIRYSKTSVNSVVNISTFPASNQGGGK